tara:strand:- start:101 stop:577 length:477 start_codon:yes stop_codon:yes gene_type:complete
MKKKISLEFFFNSKRWSPKSIKIKTKSIKILKIMRNIFKDDLDYNINIILTDGTEVTKLNKKYKNKHKDTDVLTFVNNNKIEKIKKTLYCDLFFSIDTIEKFIIKNKMNFYDHFNHLLIHSFLHINGYKHNNDKNFKLMKYKEIEILEKIGIKNPYFN